MKYPRYVRVSLDAPDAWWDPKSGKWFRKVDGNILLEDGLDASNIVRYVRCNYLIDATNLVNPPVKESEKFQKFVEQTPRQLLREEPHALDVVVEPKVIPKETCPYCNREFAPKGLPNHIKSCKENPDK